MYEKTNIAYYNKHADAFATGTQTVEFSSIQKKFMGYLSANACILDFGCGAGRDTKAFLNQGFAVEALDGSEEMVKIATAYTGIAVTNKLFSEFHEQNKYDGIWACASLLHVEGNKMYDILVALTEALKIHGVIYVSYKYGEKEEVRNGRFFKDYTEESFSHLIRNISELRMRDCWITMDVRPKRGTERWLNVILQKETECME